MRALIVGCLTVLLAATAVAATLPHGALSQPHGTAGCFVDPAVRHAQQGCAVGHGLGSTQNLTLSADQHELYATSNDTWGVDVFKRNAQTGGLKEAQCFTVRPASQVPGCTPARGLAWSFWTTVSADGRNVYVSAAIGDSIAVFRRSTATGHLTQLPGPDGCLHSATGGTIKGGPTPQQSGCRLIDDLSFPRGIALSPDGRFLYVANFGSQELGVLARDPSTGALSPTTGLCASSAAHSSCASAPGLKGVSAVALSRDATTVYAASYDDNAVTILRRDPATGALHAIGCVAEPAIDGCVAGRGLSGAFALALSHDARSLYVAARHSSAVAVFDVDPQTGAISQKPGAAGCVASSAADGCTAARGLTGVRGVAVSGDGRTVYTGAFTSSAIGVFARTSDGTLRQLPGRSGCVAAALAGCARGRALRDAWAVTPAPDGRFLYTGVGNDGNSGLGVFSVAK